MDTELKAEVTSSNFERPPSPYGLFCIERRAAILEAKPGTGARQLMEELGALWRILSDVEKEPYEMRSKELKEKYSRDAFLRCIRCRKQEEELMRINPSTEAEIKRMRMGCTHGTGPWLPPSVCPTEGPTE